LNAGAVIEPEPNEADARILPMAAIIGRVANQDGYVTRTTIRKTTIRYVRTFGQPRSVIDINGKRIIAAEIIRDDPENIKVGEPIAGSYKPKGITRLIQRKRLGLTFVRSERFVQIA
jgi:hypothetical protein